MGRKGVAKIINRDKNKVYVISSDNDIISYLEKVMSDLENGWHKNSKLQQDYFSNPNAFTTKLITTTCKNEIEVNEVRCREIKKYWPEGYNKKCTTSHKGGNINPFERSGENEDFIMTRYMERLFKILNKSNLSQENKINIKEKIDKGNITSEFELIREIRKQEEAKMQIKNKNYNTEKINSDINASDSKTNKNSKPNNNISKKRSKNKNNAKTPFTKTAWYKEVIKPLMVQLNQYDLDDVDRKILKRKINSYKIRNSKDLEIEYLKLIKNKNNDFNELLDENNEYDNSPIKKTNRYRDELLNQLNQYNDLTDIKKNRLAKKINKGQIQTSWHLDEEVLGIQKKTRVKKKKHLNNHVPKQKQLDNNVAEQKHSNNKKNSFFNRILKLFRR